MQDLDEMCKQNYETVYKYILSYSHNENIAMELTQETFYKAIKNINKFNENSKVSTWLCEIAKNLWIDEIRKNKKIKTLEQLDEKNLVLSIDDEILADENKLRIFKEIQKLNIDMRDVMHLRLSGELSFKEIGEIMNKTENWARVTFYRGKERLREVIENGKEAKLQNN